MIETRVVDEARVNAAVKSVHMRMLKAMLRPKKKERSRKLISTLSGEREREAERAWDQDVVRAVVVLEETKVSIRGARGYGVEELVGWGRGREGETYSLANTPLIAAQVPEAIARASHDESREGALVVLIVSVLGASD